MEIKLEQEKVLDITPSISSDFLKGEKGDIGATGPQGIQGPKGEDGNQGPRGETGPQGEQGIPGKDGFNPIANISQTDEGALISITDKTGTTTAILKKGEDGANGKSAYEIWLENGNSGTEQDFLMSLKGNDGDDGKDGVSVTHSWNNTILTITSASGTSSTDLKGDKGDIGLTGPQGIKGEKGDIGPQGEQGIQGPKGDIGERGAAGTVIQSTEPTEEGTVIWINTDDDAPVFSGSYNDLKDRPGIANANQLGLVKIGENLNIDENGVLSATGQISLEETDPTVPNWAKQSTKPKYTASEVGALPDTTVIPTVPKNVSAFDNDVGYLTQHQDLSSYAKKSEIPTKTSQLTNDSEFLTSVPSNYATKTYVDELIGNIESLLSEV